MTSLRDGWVDGVDGVYSAVGSVGSVGSVGIATKLSRNVKYTEVKNMAIITNATGNMANPATMGLPSSAAMSVTTTMVRIKIPVHTSP